MTVEVYDLGRQEYTQVWTLQKRLARERAAGKRGDSLIFVEHPPVYTRGTTARGGEIPALPHPVHDVERGGDITFHGEGQLVGYPILHLRERGLLIGTYLRRLEQTLIDALSGLAISAERKPRSTGVWIAGRKVASIGVAVRGGVSLHGFSLNVRGDLAPYAAIRPCGFAPEVMTSVSRVLGREVGIAEMRVRITEAFDRIFKTEEALCTP